MDDAMTPMDIAITPETGEALPDAGENKPTGETIAGVKLASLLNRKTICCVNDSN